MPVEMIIDRWNPSRRRYRTEIFCYGPLSCPLYQPGPARTVPGRRGMTYTEEDWVDDEATSHRRPCLFSQDLTGCEKPHDARSLAPIRIILRSTGVRRSTFASRSEELRFLLQ